MKAASVNELKEELRNLSPARLVEVCIRLVKYKKENKELLNYLLFESHDGQAYIEAVKKEIDEAFAGINSSNLYFAKKSIRKILRITNKHIRYTASKETEAGLLLYFCSALGNSGIAFQKSAALNNLYHAQLKKAEKAIDTMHEDLQYEYRKELDKLYQ